MICRDASTVLLFSALWRPPSFPSALVTVIRCMSIWVSAWPQPAFSTRWQKLRVNCGRHCKGEWLRVRTIDGLNLAPAHSYCTYFHQCIKSAFRDKCLLYFESWEPDDCVGYYYTIITWGFLIEPCFQLCSNKKWKKCLHTLYSE